MSKLVSIQARVHGHVQGVFFRGFTSQLAKESGLAGCVRNLGDGTVQVYAEGKKERLKEFILHLKAGPPSATVDRVDIIWGEYSGNYSGFSIDR